MRRIVCVILTAAFCLSLVGCSSAKPKLAAKQPATVSRATSETASVGIPSTTTDTATPPAEINASKADAMRFSKPVTAVQCSDGSFMVFFAKKMVEDPGLTYHALEVRKFDKDKKLVWDQVFSHLNDVYYAVAATPDGGALIVTDAEFKTIQGVPGSSIGYLTKISASGVVKWSDKLTKNYQYVNQIEVTPSGDIYTAGSYIGNQNDNYDRGPGGSWDHNGDDSTTVAALVRYDKNGRMKAHVISDVGYYETLGYPQNNCFIQCKEGVGLVADYGTCCVCYTTRLTKRWVYAYPDVPVNQDSDSAKYSAYSNMCLTKDRIVVTADSLNTIKVRRLDISFGGKLLSQTVYPSPDTLPGSLMPAMIPLPDGRCVLMMSVQGKAMAIGFFAQNKPSVFDTFGVTLHPAQVIPNLDGGFTIGYAARNSIQEEPNYYVITRYSSAGKTEFQLISKTGNFQMLSSGLVLLF